MSDHQPAWPWWMLPAILLSAAAINASDYSVLVPRQDLRIATHRAIVNGTALPAQQHHVLVPFGLEPIIRGASLVMPTDRALTRTYAAFHLFALAGILLGTYAYCSIWFTRERSLIAALLIGSTIRLSLRQGEYWDQSPIPMTSIFAPWSLADAVIVAAAVVCLYRERRTLFLVLVAIGALNSESSIVLPFAAALNTARTGWALAGWASLTWLAITIALRVAFGMEWPSPTFADNIDHLAPAVVNLGLWLGPALLLAVAGWPHASVFSRRALLSSLSLIAVFSVFGYWRDVRVLMPLYPLVAPVLLSAIWPPRPS